MATIPSAAHSGAIRSVPISRKKLRGKISGFLCDELHEYNNASGQGDAMAELYGASKLFVGMTATLINGYSSGIFHLLYRIVPGLMLKDDKRYRKPGDFDAEYGVVENTYEIEDSVYTPTGAPTSGKQSRGCSLASHRWCFPASCWSMRPFCPLRI